MNIMVLFLR